MKRNITFLFLLLSACAKTEEGIDTTVIRGNIIIPPTSFDEPGDATNDSWLTPVELPMLSYREMTVNASAQGFGSVEDGVAGQADIFTVTAADDGAITFDLDFETGQGVGRDKTHMAINIYDMDNGEEECTTSYSCAPVEDDCGCDATYDEVGEQCVEDKGCADVCTWEIVATETCVPIPTTSWTTDGTLGDFSAALELVDGATYGIEIVATDSTEYTEPDDALPYSFRFGALTPVDDQFLVGAYLAQDVTDRGNPVAGASVYDLQWDEVDRAWVGKFEMLHVKSVTSEEANCVEETTYSCAAADCGCDASYDQDAGECVQDAACEESCTWEVETEVEEVCGEEHTVVESHPEVWLMGGSWPNLNASIPSGSLYSSEAVQVATGDGSEVVGDWGDTAEPEPEPVDTADTAGPEPVPVPRGDIVVAIDALQPKVIGWDVTEEEPNEVTLDDSLYLVVEELTQANVVPDASLDIYTDIIRGNVTLDVEVPNWANEYVDVFAITVPEDTNAVFTFEWGTATADHDFILYGSDGYYYAYSLYDYPEVIDTAQWGFHLEAGSTWYLLVLPYAGILGDDPYTIEIEYSAI
jgi:hypothetical protein